MFPEKLQTLRAEIQRGIDSGEATPLDMEDIIQRGKQRLALKKMKRLQLSFHKGRYDRR